MLRLLREMHLSRSSSKVPRLPSFLEILQNRFSHFWQGAALRLPRKNTSERPKVVRTCGFFKHFDLEMCFAPQQGALFRHFNFQKCFEAGVLCRF